MIPMINNKNGFQNDKN